MNNQEQINQLKEQVSQFRNEIESLKNQVSSLKNSSTITLEIDQSFTGRGFIKTYKPDIPDPAGDYTTNIGFRRDVTVPAEGETINVPAYPVRFLKLSDGSNLYIPLHAYAEFF